MVKCCVFFEVGNYFLNVLWKYSTNNRFTIWWLPSENTYSLLKVYIWIKQGSKEAWHGDTNYWNNGPAIQKKVASDGQNMLNNKSVEQFGVYKCGTWHISLANINVNIIKIYKKYEYIYKL
jgi:hypothetical protein